MENWKHIPNWPYEISDLGRVRNARGKVLQPRRHTHGYSRIFLCNGAGVRREEYIHRLVLMVFVGPPPFEGAEGDHANKIRNDNRLDNLSWATPEENKAHRDVARGERSGPSKITDNDVREILRRTSKRIAGQITALDASVAADFGLSREQVRDIRLRKCWRHIDA